MRTLVISDLHLGQDGGVSVLERPRPLEILLESIAAYDRLVLLGDIVELQKSYRDYSFPVAASILRAIGAAAGADRPVIFVPGNHDHALIREWSHAQGQALGRETLVPADASPQLAQVLSWLEPAKVEVRYPGVWLDQRTWATHGHYLNHYLRPISSIGVLHPRHRERPAAALDPGSFEYLPESPARPHVRDGLPPQRWHDRLMPRQLSPLLARGLGRQMRHHSLPAMAQVAQALGVDAEFVIFGHVHRRGPLPRDHASEWRGLDDRQRLINAGSWRFEPVISHATHPPHPYWPGGAVEIDAHGEPRTIGLLDELTEADFR